MPEQVERPTFSAIVDADELDQFLEAATTYKNLTEAKVHATENGLEITAVEPANVGMVEAWLDLEAFESYAAEEQVLGLPVDRVRDVLGFASSGSLARLELDPETRKLTVEVDHRTFRIALINTDSIRKEPDVPDLDLPASATVEGRDVEADVKAADMLADHLTFAAYADPDRLEVTASGDTDDVESVYHAEDAVDLDIPAGTAVRSLISVDYLKEIVGPVPSDAEVRLLVGEEYPIRLSYDLEHGGAVYHVAPRIQNS